MERKVVNEEQFRQLVIEEAKKYISTDASEDKVPACRKITFESVESLIGKISEKNKTISSIKLDEVIFESSDKSSKIDKITRDTDMGAYNNKKNVIHVNEGEKDKWQRMLKYEIPSDEKR